MAHGEESGQGIVNKTITGVSKLVSLLSKKTIVSGNGGSSLGQRSRVAEQAERSV